MSRMRLLALGLAAVVAGLSAAHACTSILVKAADGTPVYGRTLEYALETKSDVVVIPRHFAYVGVRPENAPNAKWTTRYGYAGVMSFGEPYVSDGMNEKGLAGGALYFPGFAGYTPPSKATKPVTLAPWEVVSWALSNFSTVEEVKQALADVDILDLQTPIINFTLPFHFQFHDATGASLVVEPIDGKLKVYDNPLGVLTNSPTFDWQLINIRNYVKLSPDAAPPLVLAGETFDSFGKGSGMLGIPGDPTPPSRFIRALAYVLSVKQPTDGPEGVRVVEHIMNNFDIPIGTVASAPGSKDGDFDYTQWTSVADLRAHKYYIKGYRDQVLRMVDLNAFDLDAKELRIAPFATNLVPPPLAFEKK